MWREAKSAASALAAGLLVIAMGTTAARAATPAELLYGTDHLSLLEAGTVLRYAYSLDGAAVGQPIQDTLSIRFVPADGGNGYHATASIFEKTRPVEVGPIDARRNNPLLLIFFQHDSVRTTQELKGGQRYLKRLLRDALNRPDAETRATSAAFGGKAVPATTVTLRPYEGDRNAAQMGAVEHKVFRFTLSDFVPGQIYEIETVTPAPEGGGVLVRETYRYVEKN